MVLRKDYLEKLISWKDEKVIKVITGIRRCGKSTLLMQYQDYLRQNNILDEQIIAINFEELEYEHLLDYKKLYEYIKCRLSSSKMTYVFLDEIQKVVGFEKVVDSIFVKDNIDIYITGSNSYMLSGDLATYLTGRYVELSILPLSFKEYYSITLGDKNSAFANFLKYGGMPFVATLKNDYNKTYQYLEGIYYTVIIKDIEDRQVRKEKDNDKRKIKDISLLRDVAKFLSSVVGSPVSVKSVSDYLSSNGKKVSPNTVDDYIKALTESFIFYQSDRFDVVGKQILKTNKKYYMVDLGLRNYILPKSNYDLGFSVENIVYLELVRRGFRVNVGKLMSKEVDFVARKDDTLIYLQVTADMTAESTFAREIAPLKSIKDNYEKTILTLDRFSTGNYNGIKIVNVIDWLLGI